MSAGAVRAGGVFVEIGADPRKFFSALNKVNKSLANMGGSLVSGGGRLAAAGIGMAAPIVAAVRQGQRFESTLLNIRASTGATAGEIDKIKASAMDMSRALGVGPTEAAGGMLELLKAGMSLDAVLGGAGKSALEFAKVGEMDVGQAAVVMSDAMNVFKVSSDVAANALSSAADASSTSIAQMSEAFSMSSAVAGLANQSIGDLSAALAILANSGVKGSDAGTSVKTMLMRLMAPADDAVGALQQLGLTVGSFRGADGQMRPMVEIIDTLNKSMGGLDQTAKDDVFRRLFGADAIRAASILASSGVEGFKSMQDAMASALPVGEKYKILMSGLAGAGGNILAAMQRLAISISGAVAPALASVVPFITGFINGLTDFASKNKEAVAGFAKLAVGAVAVGGTLTGLGLSLQVTAFAMGGLTKAAAVLLSPLALVARNVTLVGQSFALAMPATIKLANQIGASMLSASASVVAFVARSAASASAYAATLAGMATATAGRLGFVAATWAATGIASSAGFLSHIKAMITYYTGALAGLQAVTVSRAGATAAAWIMSSVGADTFSNAFTASMKTASASSKFAASTVGSAATFIAQSTASAAASVSRVMAPLAAPFVAVGKSVAVFASDIYGGLAFTVKSFVWWASGVSAKMVQYTANLTGAVGKTIASTAAMSAAWLGSAARGVAAFVGSAVAGIGSYLAATAMAVAGSVASAAAVAAAWLAPLAPLLLLSAAAVGVGAAVKQFGPQLSSAFSGLAGYASDAAGAIGSGLNTAINDVIVVFGDLYSTATTTFSGIYDAIAAGDLSGAMDILWAGLNAGWLRGVEALMSYVDPWMTAFQDAFTIMGAEIYKGWDALWVSVGSALNTAGAYLMGAFDNIINPILAMWDTLEAGILKSWNYIQSFFKKGFDLKKENEKVDNQMDARKRKRELERPGIAGRTEKATKENTAAEAAMTKRRDAVDANTQETIAGRQTENQQRAADRRAATVAAEGALTSLVSGKTETRARNSQVDDLLASIKGATSVDQLAGVGGLGDQFSTLRDLGRLTSEQEMMLSNALDKAAEGLTGTATAAQAGATAAGDQSATSKAEVAGTFSSTNLGGMGFGSSLAERTAKAAEDTAKGVKELVGQGGGKVAA
jgi:TP901 family phage tail tape measure protein